jgi:hypothetical protein
MLVNRIFKIAILLYFVLIYNCLSYAQDLNQKISLSVKNEKLENILKFLVCNYNLQFSYSSQIIPVDKRLSINAKNKTLKEILDKISEECQIRYEIIEKQIVLLSNTTRQNIFLKKYTISGYIKDKNSGEVLIGASVYISNQQYIGTVSNSYGFFSLTLPQGKYCFVISYLGYKPLVIDTLLDKNIEKTFYLEENTILIPSVDVKSNDSVTIDDFIRNFQRLGEKELSRMVGMTGISDAIKSLQFIPGINMMSDGSSYFYVRGGNNFQNLVLVDDAPIYNPSHLFGFFTSVIPDAIKEINVYKGNFPAYYGGRLASIVDIRTKDGNMYNYSFSGNINPFVSDFSLEGPVLKNKSSIYFSLRKSNLSWLNQLRSNSRYYILFSDLNMKFNYKLNDRNRLFWTIYGGYDEFSKMKTSKIRSFGISWNNILSAFRWNHIFNEKLFSNTTAYISLYNYFLYYSTNPDNYWTSSINKKAIKTDFTIYLNPYITMKSGFEFANLFSNPGNIRTNVNNISFPEIAKYHSNNFISYFSSSYKTKNLFLDLGIRANLWQNYGPTKVYTYNSYYSVIDTTDIPSGKVYSQFLVFEPRIKADYTINKNSIFTFSYNKTYQMENIISNSISPFNSTEILIPAGPNILPQIGNLFSLGYFYLIKKYSLLLENSLFYQRYSNQIEYKEHANLLFNPLVEGELRFGKTYSYGYEFQVKKNSGKIVGWFAYTYSRVFKEVESAFYPAIYDRPHNIAIHLTYNLTKRFRASLNWQYLTGLVVTTPIGFYYYNGYTVPIYDKKNNSRLSDYHRLDVSFYYDLNRNSGRYSHTLLVSFYNVYNRKNPISINFNKIQDNDGNYVVPSDFYNQNKLLTTIISVSGIVPSITYMFKFK